MAEADFAMSLRSARWAKVREAALQNRPQGAGWSAVLGEQKVGSMGWLAKLKRRLLGAPANDGRYRPRRGSFKGAQAAADHRRSTGAAPPSAAPDLLASAVDQLSTVEQEATPVEEMSHAPEAAAASAAEEDTRTHKGWRGSETKEMIEGVFENPDDIRARRALRRMAEVQTQVKRLWDVAYKWQNRMENGSYFDFHLSIFHYIIEKEEGETPEVRTPAAYIPACMHTHSARPKAVPTTALTRERVTDGGQV